MEMLSKCEPIPQTFLGTSLMGVLQAGQWVGRHGFRKLCDKCGFDRTETWDRRLKDRQFNGLVYRTVNGFGISASLYEILQIQIQPISDNQLILFA